MTFYFIHPITLILAYSQFGSKLKKAVLVDNYFRGANFNHYLLQVEFNHKIAKKICEILEIQFSSISFVEFMKNSIKPDLIEVNLCSKREFKKNTPIIFQSSDVYTALDKKIKLSYLRTRLKLKKSYREGIKNHLGSTIFIFSETKFKNDKYQFNYLSKDKFTSIATKIGTSLDSQINEAFLELAQKSFLLVMPPLVEIIGDAFYDNFMKKAFYLAEKNKLEILIKPHRKDSRQYTKTSSKNKFVSIENISQYPIEFLFNLPCIKLIVSEPSSSLIFAPKSNVEVFVPKNRKLYRRYYLNQECFLENVQIKYEYL